MFCCSQTNMGTLHFYFKIIQTINRQIFKKISVQVLFQWKDLKIPLEVLGVFFVREIGPQKFHNDNVSKQRYVSSVLIDPFSV